MRAPNAATGKLKRERRKSMRPLVSYSMLDASI
jgi:hypothetical protein